MVGAPVAAPWRVVGAPVASPIFLSLSVVVDYAVEDMEGAEVTKVASLSPSLPPLTCREGVVGSSVPVRDAAAVGTAVGRDEGSGAACSPAVGAAVGVVVGF